VNRRDLIWLAILLSVVFCMAQTSAPVYVSKEPGTGFIVTYSQGHIRQLSVGVGWVQFPECPDATALDSAPQGALCYDPKLGRNWEKTATGRTTP
jgi:hypothetical protein